MVPLREDDVSRNLVSNSAVRKGGEVNGDIDQSVADVLRMHVTNWGVGSQVADWLESFTHVAVGDNSAGVVVESTDSPARGIKYLGIKHPEDLAHGKG